MNEDTIDVVLFEVKENVTINIFAADIDSEPTQCITETWTEGVTVTNIVCTAAGLCGVLLIIGELWATGSRRTCPYKITGLTDQVYAAQLFSVEVVWPQFQSGSFVKTTSIFQNFNF